VKGEGFRALAEDCGAEDVGRHQVWRGLDALKAEAEQLAEGFDDESLGDAWHAFQQGVPLAEDGDHDFFNDFRLAGDDTAQLLSGVGDQLAGGSEAAVLRTFCVLVEFLLVLFAHEALSCGLG